MKRASDIKGVVKRQRMYSTLARREGQYAEKKEKEEAGEGAPEMAKDSKREAKIAFVFAKKRKEIANNEEKKLRKTTKKRVKK